MPKNLLSGCSHGNRTVFNLGTGYDTFAYRQPLWAKALQIFEVDHPATARDKQERLKSAGIVIPDNVHYIEADFTKGTWKKEMQNHNSFNSDKISYCSILGVAYYLSKESFESVISSISSIVAKGSSIIFDYPDENSYTEKAGERTKKQFMLAGVANEKCWHVIPTLISNNCFQHMNF